MMKIVRKRFDHPFRCDTKSEHRIVCISHTKIRKITRLADFFKIPAKSPDPVDPSLVLVHSCFDEY